MKPEGSPNRILYHITHPESWHTAKTVGKFREPSLESEGFIHCSFLEQMIKTANRFYKGQSGLLILKIDPEKLKPEVRLEAAENGELFPHIFGEVNIDAVSAVLPFSPDPDGNFSSLPDGVE